MKKHLNNLLIFGTLFFTLPACQTSTSTTVEAPAPKKNYADLLSSYSPLSIDSLLVYYTDSEVKEHKYYGTALDSTLLNLLPPNYDAENRFGEFFACYKFEIDKQRTGLITRVPGEYVSSRLDLLIYNAGTDTIEDQFMLADVFGDAGDVYVRNSLLFFNQKKLQVFVEDYSSYDHSVDDEKDSTVTESTTYFALDLANSKHDTISKNDSLFIKRYLRLCKSKAKEAS